MEGETGKYSLPHVACLVLVHPARASSDGVRCAVQLIKALEAARGNGTSMISLIMPPKDQVRLVTALLYVVQLRACRPLQLVCIITRYEQKISN